jgi:hypothetical protein
MRYDDPNFSTEYRGYQIKLKRDFGNQPFLVEGHMLSHGYVVIKDGALATPGAVWHYTVADAKLAIDDMIAAGDRKHRVDGQLYPIHEFHMRQKFRRAVDERSLALYHAVRQHLEATHDATGGPIAELRKVLDEIEGAVDMRERVVYMSEGGREERRGRFSPAMRDILDEALVSPEDMFADS